MLLAPCGECGRHVDQRAHECPFCAAGRESHAPSTPSVPSVSPLVRMSRASVFVAGVAVTGCYTSSNPPPPQYTQQPHQQEQQEQQAPPPPDDDRFAKPPDNAHTQNTTSPKPATPGHVSGTIFDAATRQPLPGVRVIVTKDTGNPQQRGDVVADVVTGTSGELALSLPQGDYTVTILGGVQGRQGWPTRRIAVRDQPVKIDVGIDTYQRQPIAAPYGAPPSRRRVV